jgi:hypothetical protein
MAMEPQAAALGNFFDDAREQFEDLVTDLGSSKTAAMTHSEVETLLEERGTELMRRMYQGYLDAQGVGEVAGEVRAADGGIRTHRRVEGRNLMTVFGRVRVSRMGYGAREATPLYPLDGELNLPDDSYSLGTRRRAVEEAAKVSFDEAVKAVEQSSGAWVPKRQLEQLVVRAAQDFDAFYAEAETTATTAASTGPIMVITADGKGVVMRREDLRDATRKAAEKRVHKLQTRLTKGEKRNAKRMAEVAAVYTIARHKRTAEDIIGEAAPVRDADSVRPRPEHKRVWASLEKHAAEVIEDAFSEALRRDPARRKEWVALVDGNDTQLELLRKGARKHGLSLVIILDFIHVLEYLWRAGHELFGEGKPETEAWVRARALAVLHGDSSLVAAGMRRSATKRGLGAEDRVAIDDCANYLLKYRAHLRYDEYLESGYPIATGVIEGACRHLVKDRMDITGARWRLERAEAILQLRALRSSGDFDAYWRFHEAREQIRNHTAHYRRAIPRTLRPSRRERPRLALVN